MSAQVYISHADEDADTAEAIRSNFKEWGLESCTTKTAKGLGTAYWHTVRSCPVFLVLMSAKANASEGVRKELGAACENKAQIVPVFIEDVEPAPCLAAYLGGIQEFPACTPPLEQHLTRLRQHVRRQLEKRQPAPTYQTAIYEPGQTMCGVSNADIVLEDIDLQRRGSVSLQPLAMPAKVFISHATEDATPANTVCQALESGGAKCWIAPRDIAPGVKYPVAIVNAIKSCPVFLLLLSRHANVSEHVQRELEHAAKAKAAIIPLRIEAVEPGPALEYYLSNIQWFEAHAAPLDQYLPHLVEHVSALLRKAPVVLAHLAVTTADGHMTVFPLRGKTVIGRHAGCDIFVEDTRASRQHCTIELGPELESFTIVDNNSTNGTRLNGQRLQPGIPMTLADGDTLTIGRTALRLVLPKDQGVTPLPIQHTRDEMTVVDSAPDTNDTGSGPPSPCSVPSQRDRRAPKAGGGSGMRKIRRSSKGGAGGKRMKG